MRTVQHEQNTDERPVQRTVGIGIIAYVYQSKIEHAKKYIREEIYILTEISDLLGYSSVLFPTLKEYSCMTPSEYARTIKARNEAMS